MIDKTKLTEKQLKAVEEAESKGINVADVIEDEEGNIIIVSYDLHDDLQKT